MTESVAQVTMRLTVLGDAGRLDLAVPVWSDVASVRRRYVESSGDRDDVRLTTTTGAMLDPPRTVSELGLQHGDVIVATSPGGATPNPQEGHERASATRPAAVAALRAWLALVAAGCALVAGATAALLSDGLVHDLSVVALLLGAVLAQVPSDRAPGDARTRSAGAPAFAAAAGFAAAYSTEPGGLLLGIAAGAIAAAAGAGTARALVPDAQDEYLVVWLWVSGVVAMSATALLLIGSGPRALWAVLFAAGVLTARLLPSMVVDVPDQVLLDLDRLAITAWSAREQPRRNRRRRTVIRPDAVAEMAHRGRRLVAAGTVAATTAVGAGGSLTLLEADDGVQGIGARVLVLVGAAALALVARSVRARTAALLIRLSAGLAAALVGVDVLLGSGVRLAWVAVGVTVIAGLLTATAAVALGRGWRSVWWARLADLTEGLCTALVVAAVPVATGLFDAVRQFVS